MLRGEVTFELGSLEDGGKDLLVHNEGDLGSRGVTVNWESVDSQGVGPDVGCIGYNQKPQNLMHERICTI